jgi:hypothetical protein
MSTQAADDSGFDPPAGPVLSRDKGGWWSRIPIHTVLFAAFPVLALYSRNAGAAQLTGIWKPLTIAVLTGLGALALACLLLRPARRAALAASAVVVALFSYGHVSNLFPAQYRIAALPLCAAALLLALFFIVRSRGSFSQPTRALNLASAILVMPSLWAVALGLLAANRTSPSGSTGSRERVGISKLRLLDKSTPPGPDLPDIYYIVLDAYGRDDSLREFYGFDNTPFLNELEKRGFYIARNSRSNYDQTGPCIASALNMDYMAEVEANSAPPEGYEEFLRKKIDTNRVASRLKKRGYRYVSVWSGTGQTRPESADAVLGANPEEVMSASLEGTLYGVSIFAITEKERNGLAYRRHREQIDSALNDLKILPRHRFQKFVFAHILAPHPPFVFGANGEALTPAYGFSDVDGSWLLKLITPKQYREGYTAQLQYINNRVLEAIDSILQSSQRPPVIILQGDHGSRMNLNWESLEKSDIRETFSILNAYYVPDTVRARLYDEITPINSFRTVLAGLFGEELKQLPDRSYYSTAQAPMAFTDVTPQVRAYRSKHHSPSVGAAGSGTNPKSAPYPMQ